MKIGQHINFTVINKQATSLFLLIADGKYRAISLGRNKWKTLIGRQARLQHNCNKEGFNAWCTRHVHYKSRIGIFGNNEDDCVTCDSRIGFGTGWPSSPRSACGNDFVEGNQVHSIKAIGYILVQ